MARKETRTNRFAQNAKVLVSGNSKVSKEDTVLKESVPCDKTTGEIITPAETPVSNPDSAAGLVCPENQPMSPDAAYPSPVESAPVENASTENAPSETVPAPESAPLFSIDSLSFPHKTKESNSRSFYLKDSTFTKLESFAKKNGVSSSVALSQILDSIFR